jgi:hypothetical protein
VKTLVRLVVMLVALAGLSLPAVAQRSAAAAEPAEAAEPAVTTTTEAVATPPSNNGKAEVKIGVYVNDIQSIDLQSYSYVADIYVWFRDRDPSLVPGQSFEWMNMFAPDDHVQTAIYAEPQPQPDGSQYQVFRHQGPFAAKFSIGTYPFDKHKLTIEIEDQEWNADRLVYVVDQVTMNPNIKLPGFDIGAPTLEVADRAYPTNFGDQSLSRPESYSRAVVTIPISRPVWSGITKSLLPVFIVVLVAAAALLLNPTHVEARVGLSITALLTLVALQFSAMASLPEVGYLLMLDQVYLASYGFVLLVVALLVASTVKEDKAQESGAEAVARGGPLTAFLAVALYGAIISVVLWLNLK